MEHSRRIFYSIKHTCAVLIGFLRRPGRFSVINYHRAHALERLKQSRSVLDLGCGTRHLADHVISLDLVAHKGVSVVGNALSLPFKRASFEGVWLEAVLEHVQNPEAVLSEIDRVLKPNGWLYIEVPFLQGEHSAPSDYRRWTTQGLRELLSDWQIETVGMSSGPFSALAYQLRVCLSILTSFGSSFLYRILFEAVWGYAVWPLKFLDFFVKKNAAASAHAFGYAVMAKKTVVK